VDGAQRMREIILDLLEFSKVGNHNESKLPMNTASLVREVLLLNKKIIQEKNAIIHVGNFPTAVCHGNLIIQLFQNLLINGLKYQSGISRPEIWIAREELDRDRQI